MIKEPKKSDSFSSDRICMECAWTPLGDMSKGIHCCCYEKTFNFEYQNTASEGYQLKMEPCPSFYSIGILSDIKRGVDFAMYFQNRKQLHAGPIRSWIAIGISVLALLVSVYAIFFRK